MKEPRLYYSKGQLNTPGDNARMIVGFNICSFEAEINAAIVASIAYIASKSKGAPPDECERVALSTHEMILKELQKTEQPNDKN